MEGDKRTFPMDIDSKGIILAAGFSSRAGTFKPELPFGKKKLLERVIEGMTDACSQIIVVGGYNFSRVKEIAEKYPTVRTVFSENYQKGMFSSVQAGVHEILTLPGDAFFIIPGDYPFIPKDVYKKLKQAMVSRASRGEEGDIFIPVFQGKKGHPVLFKKRIAKEIVHEPADSMLKSIVRRNRCVLVDVDHDGILKDVDTMEDYENLVRSKL
jgi:molybdenum cofactor cytidylyltransferase